MMTMARTMCNLHEIKRECEGRGEKKQKKSKILKFKASFENGHNTQLIHEVFSK